VIEVEVALVCAFGILFMIGVLTTYRKQAAKPSCESVQCEPDPAWDVYIDHPEPGVARAVPRDRGNSKATLDGIDLPA
jgi:hypothetical protein